MTKIKIYIIEFRKLIRESLVSIFSKLENIQVVGYACDIKSALGDMKKNTKPEMVFIGETELGQRVDIKMMKTVKNTFPSAKIILISEPEKTNYILEELIAGIDGYISREWGIKELNKALSFLKEGEIILPRALITILIKEIRRFISPESLNIPFTSRERTVIKLLIEGKANKEMANTLGIAERTVKYYCSSLYKKLKVRKRSEAIARIYSSAHLLD
ncbi:MAG: response regulator transcription factor [Candidatus Firestonebacteria bacterium]